MATVHLEPTEPFARQLDDTDPLAHCRALFHLPRLPDGAPKIYFCGNSLGLQPKSIKPAIEQELRDWAELAVDGHFHAQHPWYPYHEFLREPGARLVGALPHEVVYMNGLTVNLHLMMVSFYYPLAQRYRILMEDSAFPSDTYAAQTQIRYRGYEPERGLVTVKPRPGEHCLRTDDIVELLEREGREIQLVLFSGVNYFTGQVFDIARITAAARSAGCVVGFDLAHAVGNTELRLHDWNVDFAVWCTYKYLNSGPGSVAGCFIHERHFDLGFDSFDRFGGWWGNDPATRFRMHLNEDFVPVKSADAWQVSNPPILSMAAVRASLELFDQAGMPALREKSLRLTGYLQYLLDQMPSERYTVITPRDPAARGCQLSILAHDRPRELHQELETAGVVCDFREPNVIRVAPVPLYNTFHEVWRFAQVLARHS